MNFNASEPVWISEADVVSMIGMADAIQAVEAALRAEARGDAENMQKTVLAWPVGTLHALGARLGDVAGTKTWVHTDGGATPLLILYDSATGSLLTVIEAFALGQLRTGAVSGVATRWMAAESADEMAIVGTGKQAFTQVAAVAAVRPLRRVRVYSRNEEHRRHFAARVQDELKIEAEAAPTLVEAVRDVRIITTATRSREPFLTAAMISPGTHINAIGAIVPSGAEIAQDVFEKCNTIVVDSVPQAQKLSRELIDFCSARGGWNNVRPLSQQITSPRRDAEAVTLFKSLGVGIADLALGIEVHRRAVERGRGRQLLRPDRERKAFVFLDRSGAPAKKHQPQEPVLITGEDLDSEVQRLASLPAPANGRRLSLITNPVSGTGNGLAPGTAVSLCVLKPGERTRPLRENASLVNFCIRGRGTSIVAGKQIRFSQYDVWNIPPWSAYEYVNDSDELQVRLTYSNSALLEKLNVHIVDEDLVEEPAERDEESGDSAGVNPFGTFRLAEDSSMLMPYEKLISPDVVRMEALHWPWAKVREQLDKLITLGRSYTGRRLYLLYNHATGRTNGTSHSFFATMCVRPANVVDRPHRHTASAINYFFTGSGSSVIEGKRYPWKAGDLMLTAPGWAIHNHSSHGEDVYELTIQDSPLQIALGSLLWQEDLSRPPEVLGATGGFATNRAKQEVGI